MNYDIKAFKTNSENYPDPLGVFRGDVVVREYHYGSNLKTVYDFSVLCYRNGVTDIVKHSTNQTASYRRGFRQLAFDHVKKMYNQFKNKSAC